MLSHPQQPCSAPMASFIVNPCHIWSSLSWLPSVFPSIVVFCKDSCLLMMCLKQDSNSSVIFTSSDVSGLISCKTLVHLAVQGIYRSLLQRHSSNKLLFQPSFTVQLSYLYIVIGNTRVWMVLPWFLMTHLCSLWCFLILPLLPLWVSAFSWFFWWHPPFALMTKPK